ncbi:MAG: sce7725 family protein [Candidatus Marinimicrobia bacterium]|nr:sce7725 family protein [Candidatus Neomarinimicrobiota bacterium]
MYFPFLRGKQYELIALRELSLTISENQDKISPIIEPVKKSTSTLRLTVQSFKEREINFNIILNPIVGDFLSNRSILIDFINDNLNDYSNYQITFNINSTNSFSDCYSLAQQIEPNYNGFTFVHLSALDDISEISQFTRIKAIKYNIIDFYGTNRRYHRNFDQNTIVSLEDRFNMLTKNSEYLDIPDEPFSEEHLYYQSDGFEGFSDYLAIGEPYSESGFLPYAVVIHLTYLDSGTKIRIRHFVSDSNDDIDDPAGKFSEALHKLVDWLNTSGLDTQATRIFRDLHRTGHFPGLGVLKKLSIMNHIELVISIL